MADKATIDGHEFVSVRVDAIREGDLVHHDGQRVVVWGIEVTSEGSRTLFLGTTADVPFEFRGEIDTWNSNAIWLGAYDAEVTGRG